MNTAHTEQFVESFGLVMQAEGFPRIAGRLMATLVLRGGPLSFAELSKALRVSRASISTNARLLEDLGAIERVSMPGERQDFFRLADTPYREMIRREIGRARRASTMIAEARDALPDGDPAAKARMAELSQFFGSIADACTGALLRMEPEPAADDGTDRPIRATGAGR